MRKVLTALLTAGCFAAAAALSVSAANAQTDAWNGGWHVGGDYYYPTDYSYGAAPVYDYGSAPAYNSVVVGAGYGAAPVYGYGAVPAYNPVVVGAGYGPAPLYNYGAAPAYGPYGSVVVGAGYASAAPLYGYGPTPAYGPYGSVAVGAPMQPVQTVEVVRTVYPSPRWVANHPVVTRQVVARRTTGRTPQRETTAASNVAAPAYQNATYYSYGTSYSHPIYDAAAPVNGGAGYRYVYERNRTLVIDPNTNAVVQTLQR